MNRDTRNLAYVAAALIVLACSAALAQSAAPPGPRYVVGVSGMH